MLTIEGSIHHDNGQTTSFLIAPGDASWQQWGGTKQELGAGRDYVHAMTVGLAENSDYFRQEAADAPETDETPEMAQAPTDGSDSPAADSAAAPVEGVVLDEEPATYKTFGELALWYSMKNHGKGTAELDKPELKAVKKAVKRMVRENPDLLPAAERERFGI